MRFEGDEVLKMEAILPRTTVDCDSAYKKDTRLDLQVQVRVCQVRFDDNRDGGVKRVHVFEVESLYVADIDDDVPGAPERSTYIEDGRVFDSATGTLLGHVGETGP